MNSASIDPPELPNYIIEMADERFEELMSQGVEVSYGDCVEWACQQDAEDMEDFMIGEAEAYYDEHH